MRSWQLIWCGLLFMNPAGAQSAAVAGRVVCGSGGVPLANVLLEGTGRGALTDSLGHFMIADVPGGNYMLQVSCMGYEGFRRAIMLRNYDTVTIAIPLLVGNRIMEEIVITGVSKATRIRENPVAIVSVSSVQIDRAMGTNVMDALVKSVPGLNVVKTGPNISKPFIRGLGYNRVLTLYDGLRQEGQQWGDEHGIEVDAYNIDRVEVVKGPSSLLYGSDALAGVVSLFPFITDSADKKLHGRFTEEFQGNNNLIGTGLRLGYITRHFLFAARGAWRIAKDYRSPVDGRVYLTRFYEKNGSVLLGYRADKGFAHLNFTLYDNRQAIPDGSRDSLTRKFTKQVYEGDRDTIALRPLVTDKELHAYKLPALSQHIQHYRAYLNSRKQAGNGSIDLQLGLQQNIRREYNHPTIPQQPGMYVRLNTLNYGLRYNAPGFAQMEMTVGINGMLQNNKSLSATDFPIPDYELKDGGIYLYTKWKNNRWAVSGGMRYDARQVQWNNFYVKRNPVTGLNQQVVVADTAGALLQFEGYRKTFGGVSASLGLTFRVTRAISLKANIGRGYRAPNITEMASNGLDPGAHIIYLGNRHFNPEFSLQEDIGASARFRNFSVDASLFNTTIQNYIYLNRVMDAGVDAQGNPTYQYRQARAQLYGAEIWLAAHPEKIKGLRIDNSLAFVYGYNKEAGYKNKGNLGEYLPLIPPLKLASSVAQVIQPVSKYIRSVTPKAEMEFAAAQRRFLGLDNTETATPSYILFDCGIIAEIGYPKTGNIQVQLQINNLFNKAFQSNLNRLKYFEQYAPSPGGHSGIYNMGRNSCFKMIFSF